MKHPFLLIAITSVMALGFCACHHNDSTDQPNPFIAKLEAAAKQMKEREDKRWKAVLEKIKNDSSLLNQLNAFAPGNKFAITGTGEVEILVAQAFINQYKASNPVMQKLHRSMAAA